jgi:2'-deoxynucleoside 5'-phosphate N-hydrolase
MKIYFAGSIRGGRQDVDLYAQIIEYLKTKGEVLTEHVGNKQVVHNGKSDYDRTPKFIHDRDLKWLNKADVVVGEVTVTSLGVGYEIGRAFDLGKKILCLYRDDPAKLSRMVLGCPGVIVKYYKTLDEAKKIINDYFQTL